MSETGNERLSWPELVGLTGVEAAAKVHETHPELKTFVLNQNSPVTRDYRLDRVRIFIDEGGKVVRAPQTG